MALFAILERVLAHGIDQPTQLMPIVGHTYLPKYSAKLILGAANPVGSPCVAIQCKSHLKDDLQQFKAFCNLLISEIEGLNITILMNEWDNVRDVTKTTRDFFIPLKILEALATKQLSDDQKLSDYRKGIVSGLIQALKPSHFQMTASDLVSPPPTPAAAPSVTDTPAAIIPPPFKPPADAHTAVELKKDAPATDQGLTLQTPDSSPMPSIASLIPPVPVIVPSVQPVITALAASVPGKQPLPTKELTSSEFLVSKTRALLEQMVKADDNQDSYKFIPADSSVRNTCFNKSTLSLNKNSNGQVQVSLAFSSSSSYGLAVAFLKSKFVVKTDTTSIVDERCKLDTLNTKISFPLDLMLTLVSDNNEDAAACKQIQANWIAQSEAKRAEEAIRTARQAAWAEKFRLETEEQARQEQQRQNEAKSKEEAQQQQEREREQARLREKQKQRPALSPELKQSGMLDIDAAFKTELLRRNIELLIKENELYRSHFYHCHETELTPYYEEVFKVFAEEFSQCAIEFNAQCHDMEKLKELADRIDMHIDHFRQFTRLIHSIFEVEGVDGSALSADSEKLDIAKITPMPADKVLIKGLTKNANALIEEVGVTGLHRLALNIANFIVKALTAIGIPATTTGAGAYAGAIVGGILGAPTVVVSGPIGPSITASVGALIGGGVGFLTGASATYATSAPSKVGFFNPVNTALQAFSEKAVEHASDIATVRSVKLSLAPALIRAAR